MKPDKELAKEIKGAYRRVSDSVLENQVRSMKNQEIRFRDSLRIARADLARASMTRRILESLLKERKEKDV